MTVRYSHWAFRLPILQRFDAVCVGRVVLFKSSITDVSVNLMRHEMVHQQQMDTYGVIGFYFLYAVNWLLKLIQTRSFSRAYRENPLEVEAYNE